MKFRSPGIMPPKLTINFLIFLFAKYTKKSVKSSICTKDILFFPFPNIGILEFFANFSKIILYIPNLFLLIKTDGRTIDISIPNFSYLITYVNL